MDASATISLKSMGETVGVPIDIVVRGEVTFLELRGDEVIGAFRRYAFDPAQESGKHIPVYQHITARTAFKYVFFPLSVFLVIVCVSSWLHVWPWPWCIRAAPPKNPKISLVEVGHRAAVTL